MQEQVDQIFLEEIREKKAVAGGVRGKKGKQGRVGKMITPADVAGREYREARDLPTFNVYDFMHKLQEAPTLKSVLLARMDEEYQNYRRATEKTLDAVSEILQLGLEPVYRELGKVHERLNAVLGEAEAWPADGVDGRPHGGAAPGEAQARKKRIRWGSTPEDIRETVFSQLNELVERGEEISTETIKEHVPSMLRWIYGDRAVFEGIEGLRREFLRRREGSRPEDEVQPA